MRILLAILAWLLTVLIAVLGIFDGQTIWLYAEPVIDVQPMPDSYFVAAYAGLAALAISFVVSVVATIFAIKKA